MTNCPYMKCRGQRGHAGPHLFEAPDIERFQKDAARTERRRLLKAVGAMKRVDRFAIATLLEDPTI